jgi:CBS domain-containing protein
MAEISSKVQPNVAIIDENLSALDAARVMVERYIGSVVVGTPFDVKGIFTERDLMRVVANGQDVAKTKLKDVMRTNLVRVAPTETVEQCMDVMRANRFRHLLVYDGDELLGIVSLRDLAALMLEEKETLVQDLQKYISGY